MCAACPESQHWCVRWALQGWRTCRVLHTHCTLSLRLHRYSLEDTHIYKKCLSVTGGLECARQETEIIAADIELTAPLETDIHINIFSRYVQTWGANDQHAAPRTFSSRKQWEDIIWSRLDLISAWLADAVWWHSSRRASRLAVSCSSTKVYVACTVCTCISTL